MNDWQAAHLSGLRSHIQMMATAAPAVDPPVPSPFPNVVPVYATSTWLAVSAYLVGYTVSPAASIAGLSSAYDDATAINYAASQLAAQGGGTVYLLPGTYELWSPIVISGPVTLRGAAPVNQAAGRTIFDLYGTVLQVTSGWAQGTAAAPGAIVFDSTAASLFRPGVTNLWVDCRNAPAGVTGIYGVSTASHSVSHAVIDHAGIWGATGYGIYAPNNGGIPDGWTLDTVMVELPTLDGFHYEGNDLSAMNCHAQNGNTNGTNNSGWFVQGGNNRLTGCRADTFFYGFTITRQSQSGSLGADAAILVNCGSQSNTFYGVHVVDAQATGTSLSGPVLVIGYSSQGDGQNGTTGGAPYAAFYAEGKTMLLLYNCDVEVDSVQVPAGTPYYGLTTAAGGSGSGVPYFIRVQGGLWNVAGPSLINDAAPALQLQYDVHGVTGGPITGSSNVLRVRNDAGTPVDNSTQPAGAIAATVARGSITNASPTALASGTLYCRAIGLPAGALISNITFYTGATVKAGGTHGWYVLLDQNLKVLAVTADQTDAATTWGAANTAYTFPVTASVMTAYAGLYYLGIMVAATTPPNIQSAPNMQGGVNASAPILCATSSTAQTTPPAVGTTMAALTAAGTFNLYGYVS